MAVETTSGGEATSATTIGASSMELRRSRTDIGDYYVSMKVYIYMRSI